jgi:hypothetical protein
VSTRALAAVAALAAAALLLGGCTKSHPAVINSTVTETVTHTRPPPPGQALPAHTVAPLPPNQSPAKGEVEKVCPYIHSNFTDGTPNVADDEGNRVYRTTVITTMNPVGCRFYFWAGPYEAVADIVTQRYSSAAVAQSSMVATAKAGHSAQTVNGLSPGVNGVLYQTVFFSDDGSSDWACAFTKGALLVIVHTNQTNASFNAQQLAQDIAPKI